MEIQDFAKKIGDAKDQSYMHSGTIFIITKDKDNKFEVKKSCEFCPGMGLDYFGGAIYCMLKELKEPLLFDTIIRLFADKFFEYDDDENMTYIATSQENEKGDICIEYDITKNQFNFFYDDNNDRGIYASDINYIKNLSNENIEIVCSNGIYVLKPNQIIVTDYSRSLNNNISISFNNEIDKILEIEELEIGKYLPTPKQEEILNNIKETLEGFDFKVSILHQNGMNNGIEIETWTDEGVNMIHSIYFFDNFFDLYDVYKVNQEIEEIVDNFSSDEEIDLHRQDENYKQHFSIRDSLEDFEQYQERLKNLSYNFLDKYYEKSQNSIKNSQKNNENIDYDY